MAESVWWPAFAPRSDVATRCQVVPCARCDRTIRAPQQEGTPPTHAWWVEAHVTHQLLIAYPPYAPEPYAYHRGCAHLALYRAAGQRVWIWLPEYEQVPGKPWEVRDG